MPDLEDIPTRCRPISVPLLVGFVQKAVTGDSLAPESAIHSPTGAALLAPRESNVQSDAL